MLSIGLMSIVTTLATLGIAAKGMSLATRSTPLVARLLCVFVLDVYSRKQLPKLDLGQTARKQ